MIFLRVLSQYLYYSEEKQSEDLPFIFCAQHKSPLSARARIVDNSLCTRSPVRIRYAVLVVATRKQVKHVQK